MLLISFCYSGEKMLFTQITSMDCAVHVARGQPLRKLNITIVYKIKDFFLWFLNLEQTKRYSILHTLTILESVINNSRSWWLSYTLNLYIFLYKYYKYLYACVAYAVAGMCCCEPLRYIEKREKGSFIPFIYLCCLFYLFICLQVFRQEIEKILASQYLVNNLVLIM